MVKTKIEISLDDILSHGLPCWRMYQDDIGNVYTYDELCEAIYNSDVPYVFFTGSYLAWS